LKNVPKSFGFGIEAGYWILPKPLDFHLILLKTLNADDFVLRVVDTGVLAERGAWFPEFSLLSSVLFGLVMLGAAAYEFVHTDY
jgi:hypothetical protein